MSRSIERIIPELVQLRHWLHAHPELRFEEVESARKITTELQKVPGLDIEQSVGGTTGIVAVLGAEKSGPCVALRADMDALPILEATGLPYASTASGVMHACGHDGHMAALVGAVKLLAEMQDELPGPVKFIFQPAEEEGGGGWVLCEAGVLQNPPVKAIFAFHGMPDVPLGRIQIRKGAFLASVDDLSITIRSEGGHAAFPHLTTDPVVAGSHLVTALQSIVSRSVDPLESAVCTVATFHAGTANNIIPRVASLTGTIRALSPTVRALAEKRLRECAAGIAASFGVEIAVEVKRSYPAVCNESRAVELVSAAGRSLMDASAVNTEAPPVMGGEDFAYYLERIPGAMWFVGLGESGGKPSAQLHTPLFDFNDAALPTAVAMHCGIVREFFRSWRDVLC